MENIQDIDTSIIETQKNIENLDKKINTDEELLQHQKEIKDIYNKINNLDSTIKKIQDEQNKKYFENKLVEIKRLFADLMNNRILNGEFDDVTEGEKFDNLNNAFIKELEDIIIKNYNNININNENDFDYEKIKDEIMGQNFTYKTLENINEALNDEQKIILLEKLNEEKISPEATVIIANGLGFESGLIVSGENGLIKIPYIQYGTGCIIIGEGDMIYGKDYEDAYTKYITNNQENIKKMISFGAYNKTTLYTTNTDDIGKKEKLENEKIENMKEGVNKDTYELITKIGTFVTFELKGGKDKIKAEIYGKGTTGGEAAKVGIGGGLSWIHKTDNKTKFTTTFGVSCDIINYSGNDGIQREPSKVKYSIKEKIALPNGLSIGGEISTKDLEKIQASINMSYRTGQTEFRAGVTSTFKNGTPGTPTVGFGVTYNF